MFKRKSKPRTHTPLRHQDHARPLTRRQFLAQGFITGSAMVAGPSLLGLFGVTEQARAQAADCGIAVGGSGKIPFIGFDLAGGANIAGSNVMVGGQGGQLDFLPAEGYQKLGLPADMLPQAAGQTNNELGLIFHSDSAFLRGILSKTTAATRANVNGCVLCARSENDTGNNPLNPMFGIAKTGASGDLLTLIGTRNSDSGGKSRAPDSMFDASLRPTKIARPADAVGLVDTGKLVSLLDQQDATRVMQAIEAISALKINQLSESQIVKEILSCGYQQTSDLVTRYSTPDVLDPAADANIAAIFPEGISEDKIRKTASVMKLVVNGFAGAGTVQFSGYDYHNSSRATGEVRDFEAGQCIGAVLEYAALLNRPVMVYVFSDGSVSSNGEIDNSADGRGKLIWKSDSSTTSAAFFLVYNPTARPQLTVPANQQIGYFKASGSLETSASPISNNVDQLSETVVLNYLALHNQTGQFSQIFPGNGIRNAGPLDDLIAFQPIV